MSEENPKFKQIVSVGKELIWKFGLKRVSVEEICTGAKVSKVTFYKFFPNKLELLKYILQQIFTEAMQTYRGIMDNDIPFIEKVEQMIHMKVAIASTFNDVLLAEIYSGAQPELFEYIKEYSGHTMIMIRDDFTKAQEKGEIRQDLKIDFLMYFLNKILEMAQDENFTAFHEDPKEIIREMTVFFFYGIVSDKSRFQKK